MTQWGKMPHCPSSAPRTNIKVEEEKDYTGTRSHTRTHAMHTPLKHNGAGLNRKSHELVIW